MSFSVLPHLIRSADPTTIDSFLTQYASGTAFQPRQDDQRPGGIQGSPTLIQQHYTFLWLLTGT